MHARARRGRSITTRGEQLAQARVVAVAWRRAEGVLRILFLNPNTSAHITTFGLAVARQAAQPGTVFVASTGRFGAAYISSRAAAVIAGHAAMDAYARDGRGVDAVLLACFGDPGLPALREIASVPVIGMADAACRAAAGLGRFSIVTGGARWAPMLHEFVASIGLSAQLASVRTVALTGDAIAANPDAALDELARECAAARDDGADAVILGGLGLAGLAARITHRVPVPLIDGLKVALDAAEKLGTSPRDSHDHPAPPLAVVGLSPELGALLGQGMSGAFTSSAAA